MEDLVSWPRLIGKGTKLSWYPRLQDWKKDLVSFKD